MDPTARLRIATRIHFALLRHYGEDVAPGTLLNGGTAAQEALWVCAASEHAELVSLGHQLDAMLKTDADARTRRLRRAAEAEAKAKAKAKRSAPQDAAWARNTSGFGVTRLEEPVEAGHSAPVGAAPWFSPRRWLKRASPR